MVKPDFVLDFADCLVVSQLNLIFAQNHLVLIKTDFTNDLEFNPSVAYCLLVVINLLYMV